MGMLNYTRQNDFVLLLSVSLFILFRITYLFILQEKEHFSETSVSNTTVLTVLGPFWLYWAKCMHQMMRDIVTKSRTPGYSLSNNANSFSLKKKKKVVKR